MTYTPEEISLILEGGDSQEQRRVVGMIVEEASAGDARANYMIAKWHSVGAFGFEKDKKKFDKHIKVAMKRLLPDAIYDYGVALDSERGEPDRAFGYYVLAAILGDMDALDAVRRYFIYGQVVERDDFVASSIQMRKDYLSVQQTSD